MDLPKADHDQLRQLLAEEGKTISGWIRAMIKRLLGNT